MWDRDEGVSYAPQCMPLFVSLTVNSPSELDSDNGTTRGPLSNNGCHVLGVSHIPGIELSTLNAFSSFSLDDPKPSYHKHINILIKGTHHGTHTVSI